MAAEEGTDVAAQAWRRRIMEPVVHEPVAAALARLSEAQAECAGELQALSESHAASPAWTIGGGIAAVVRLCHDPASATAAAKALTNLSNADDANDDRIREAGVTPSLVTLLSGGPESQAAEAAARLLACLTCNMEATSVITEAGAIPPLVALLSGGPESESAGMAALALSNLADCYAHGVAIIEAGALPPLVALLSGGPDSEAAERAVGALRNLASNDVDRAAIIGAGAIPPLVALLSGGPEADAAGSAAAALDNLASGTNTTAVLLEVARAQTDCSSWPVLREKLRECASARLQAAEEGTDVAALERAITLATAVQVDAADMERAQKRLREINGDAERQERRESFGLGSLELPDEFVCPITMEKMRGAAAALAARIARAPPHRCHAPPACAYADPVVASDGHSYERSAILSVLRDGNGLSPLTREPLQATFFPNRALKRRMQEHEEDMLRVAATAVANAGDGAQQPGPAAGGGGSSSEPAPKRSRRAR